MRNAFAKSLSKLAREDSRIMLITADLGFQVFDGFKAEFPGRYLNVGVCEQAAVNIGAGLAAEGMRPLVYSIASFITARAFEQIRFSVAYAGLPVIIVGAGRGLTYATDGPSHHSLDDAALMGTIPGMQVVIAGCPTDIEQLFPQIVASGKPTYIGIGKYGEEDYTHIMPAKLGQPQPVRKGRTDTTIFATGDMVAEVCRAWAMLPVDEVPWVWNIHTHSGVIPPQVAMRTIVVSECFDFLSGLQAERLGPPKRFYIGGHTREAIRKKFGYDAQAIANAVFKE